MDIIYQHRLVKVSFWIVSWSVSPTVNFDWVGRLVDLKLEGFSLLASLSLQIYKKDYYEKQPRNH
jgi:hypothetical protein